MKKLLSVTLALMMFLCALPAFSAVSTATVQSSANSTARTASITATEKIVSGGVVKLTVTLAGYEDPIVSYAVKKPGSSVYTYLKKSTTKTVLSYRINTEGEYAFKAIVTESDGSNKTVTSSVISVVVSVEAEEEDQAEAGSSSDSVKWDPRTDAPAVPAALYTAADALVAINRTVLVFGESFSLPAYSLTTFFNQINSVGDLHNAYLVDGTVSYGASYDRGTGNGTITVTLNYDNAGQLVRKYYYGAETDGTKKTASLEAWVERRIAELITEGMTDTEKVKAIHDYIVSHYEYDVYTSTSGNALDYSPDSFTAFGMIKNGYGVCEAYAELFCLLSTYAGVPCYPVSGYYKGGSHMWDKVKIDGQWYNIDCTMDDPVPDTEGRVQYNCYLKSDKFCLSSGYSWESGLWPAA